MTKARVERSVKRLSPALQARYLKLQKLFDEVATSEVKVRYEIGVIVAEVMAAKDKYGTDAVGALAKALGKNKATLYRAAEVMRTWTKRDLTALLRRKNIHGLPLTWSHLVELSLVDSKDERDELISRALEHGLTVRDIVMMIRKRRMPGARVPLTLGERLATSGLRQMVSMAQTLAHKAERWDEDVFVQLRDDALTPDVTELLEQAKAANETMVEVARANIENIEQVLRRPPTAKKAKRGAAS